MTDSATSPAGPPAPARHPRARPGPGITRSSPPVGRRAGGLGGEPVGHDQPVETPFALDDLVLHVVVLGGGDAVDVVVGGHHRPGIGLRDGDLERQQVELPQRRPRRRRCSWCSGRSRTRWRPDASGRRRRRCPAFPGRRRRRACRSAADPRSTPRTAGRRAGVRCRLMVGPSTTSICWTSASSASMAPTSSAVSSLHAEASRVALGNSADDPAAAELQAADAGRAVRQGNRPQPDLRRRGHGEDVAAGEQPDLGRQIEAVDQLAVARGIRRRWARHILVGIRRTRAGPRRHSGRRSAQCLVAFATGSNEMRVRAFGLLVGAFFFDGLTRLFGHGLSRGLVGHCRSLSTSRGGPLMLVPADESVGDIRAENNSANLPTTCRLISAVLTDRVGPWR